MKTTERRPLTRTWQIPATYGVTGGRPRGAQLREAIMSEIYACPADGVLCLDLSSVRTLDFSAADEVFGVLIGRVISGDLGSRRFVLTGLDESVRESIEAVLKLRKRQCLEIQADSQVRVLGPISSAHEETLQFVTARGEAAVADVAAQFWTEPNMTAATNRLNTLADAGLVVRRLERGGPRGNRYVYAPIAVSAKRTKRGVVRSRTSKTKKGDKRT